MTKNGHSNIKEINKRQISPKLITTPKPGATILFRTTMRETRRCHRK